MHKRTNQTTHLLDGPLVSLHFLAKHIHDCLKERLQSPVTLRQSHARVEDGATATMQSMLSMHVLVLKWDVEAVFCMRLSKAIQNNLGEQSAENDSL